MLTENKYLLIQMLDIIQVFCNVKSLCHKHICSMFKFPFAFIYTIMSSSLTKYKTESLMKHKSLFRINSQHTCVAYQMLFDGVSHCEQLVTS